jgi:hypothetical protein
MPTAKSKSMNVVEVDEITLDGRKVRVRNLNVPLDEVHLDPRNPRIANTVAASSLPAGALQQEKRIAELLWEDPDVRDLYRQILANGGLIERIIISEAGRVVEGNCRTVCYRKLHEKLPNDERWRSIPARILPTDIGEREIAILLGEMHVAGKNTWTPFEKAGHIYRLHRDFSQTQEEIAARFRMSKSKVNQLIRAFETMKTRFLAMYPGHANIRKFSYFEEFYRKPELREWIVANPEAEDLFVKLVGGNKLTQGTHVRELSDIVRNEEALAVLQEDGFAAAKRVLDESNPAANSRLFKRMAEMTDALKQAQVDEIRRIRSQEHGQARRIVIEMTKALEHFLELCNIDRGADR